MSLDRQVFLSLLALDAYNRGPGAGLTGLGVPDLDAQGNPVQTIQIGRAQVLSGSEAILGPASLAAGFSAVAYELDGETESDRETIISYRGTNFPGGNKSLGETVGEFTDFLRDFLGGWSLFTGFTRPVQVEFARDFYEEVTGENFRGEDGFHHP